MKIQQVLVYIVTYLLKGRTVEAEKQPLLGNARTQQYEMWPLTTVAMEQLSKHIPAEVKARNKRRSMFLLSATRLLLRNGAVNTFLEEWINTHK
jgi:hypothetical protein